MMIGKGGGLVMNSAGRTPPEVVGRLRRHTDLLISKIAIDGLALGGPGVVSVVGANSPGGDSAPALQLGVAANLLEFLIGLIEFHISPCALTPLIKESHSYDKVNAKRK
jgi:hypothetical protein